MPAADGRHFDERMAELDRAVGEMIADAEARPAPWTRDRQGKWSGAQHAAHVAIAMEVTADAFEQRLPHVLDATIPAVPRRGPVRLRRDRPAAARSGGAAPAGARGAF